MDHVAIMKKSWGMIPKILTGEKKIESRWGINKCTPWGKINQGDTVYFKNSGEPVTVRATVYKIQVFTNLNPKGVREILTKYGGKDGIAVGNIEATITWAKKKRYCTLIYLASPQPVKPFNINKSGFGTPAAWLCVPNINRIKINTRVNI